MNLPAPVFPEAAMLEQARSETATLRATFGD